MVFGFYYRLSQRRRQIYDRSDTLRVPRLDAGPFAAPATALRAALEAGDQHAVNSAAQAIADAFTVSLKLPPVRVSVLRKRPQRAGSEYHGLYVDEEDGRAPQVMLWMYTARRHQVVAFRTFLRTLVHELCHHLDFAGFRLPESLHTEGFYERESALFRDIVGERRREAPSRRRS